MHAASVNIRPSQHHRHDCNVASCSFQLLIPHIADADRAGRVSGPGTLPNTRSGAISRSSFVAPIPCNNMYAINELLYPTVADPFDASVPIHAPSAGKSGYQRSRTLAISGSFFSSDPYTA